VGEAFPARLPDTAGQVSAQFGFREFLADGWRATDIGFIAPEMVKDKLIDGSLWLVMEGARVVGQLVVTEIMSTDF
jgi:hypothetical protein